MTVLTITPVSPGVKLPGFDAPRPESIAKLEGVAILAADSFAKICSLAAGNDDDLRRVAADSHTRVLDAISAARGYAADEGVLGRFDAATTLLTAIRAAKPMLEFVGVVGDSDATEEASRCLEVVRSAIADEAHGITVY